MDKTFALLDNGHTLKYLSTIYKDGSSHQILYYWLMRFSDELKLGPLGGLLGVTNTLYTYDIKSGENWSINPLHDVSDYLR